MVTMVTMEATVMPRTRGVVEVVEVVKTGWLVVMAMVMVVAWWWSW